MSKSKTPIFRIPEPQHFSDYGFDPQIDYFQLLEEARRHGKRGQDTKSRLDSVHLKLQKPISKESKRKQHHRHSAAAAGKWWRSAGSALLFWKRAHKNDRNSPYSHRYSGSYSNSHWSSSSASGPLYATEDYGPMEVLTCRSGIGTYYNLRELNNISSEVETGGNGAPHLPIYLVT